MNDRQDSKNRRRIAARRVRLSLIRISETILWWVVLLVRLLQRRPPEKKLLVVIPDQSGLAHGAAFIWLWRNDPTVKVCFLCPSKYRQRLNDHVRSIGAHADYITLKGAVFGRWDAIAFTHHFFVELFPRDARKIFIGHGLFTGKRLSNDQDYVYGSMSRRSETESRYTRMIATFEAEMRFAKESGSGSVVCMGTDAMLEWLLDARRHADAIRAKYAVGPGKKVILIYSTWRSGCLFGEYGQTLDLFPDFDTERYQVVMTLHPHWLRTTNVPELNAVLKKKNISLIKEEAEISGYQAIADYAIGDHSSVGVYCHLIGVPLIIMHAPERSISTHSIFFEIAKNAMMAHSWDDAFRHIQNAESAPAANTAKQLLPNAGRVSDYKNIFLGTGATTT